MIYPCSSLLVQGAPARKAQLSVLTILEIGVAFEQPPQRRQRR